LVFLRGAWSELRNRLPGMMTLISLAITVAFLFSIVVDAGLIDAVALWWELATLVTIMLLGHWIEMRSIDQASGALSELAKLLPDTATASSTAARSAYRRVSSARATWSSCARARASRSTA
jgi:P-type Cu2+ transporter